MRMKRVISLLLLFAFSVSPLSVCAKGETMFTVSVPNGKTLEYTGNAEQDAFALAVGYSLSEDCPGLAGYVVTVRWDPTVLSLRTDYREDMTDSEMLNCTGCYFEDRYGDGLQIAPSGTCVINYRNVKNGELTVASISATDKPLREAVLFVLDFAPLRDDCESLVTVSVKDELGLTSASGMIEEYKKKSAIRVKVGSDTLFGDIDGSGTVGQEDLELIKKHATGICRLSGSAFHRADVNDDGRVNGVDYMLICREMQK